MRIFAAALTLLPAAMLTALAEDPTSQPAKVPASRPTDAADAADAPATKPDFERRVRTLVKALGSSVYRERERAQLELSRMGESAVPVLVDFIGDSNPEIANRATALIKRPTDPALRVETAARLIATADPDHIELGVYMLFESPVDDYDLLVQRTRGLTGIQKAVFEPILEQMAQWRAITIRHLERRKALLIENRLEVAENEQKEHGRSMYYQAEAAYMLAVDAALDYGSPQAEAPQAATQPAPTTQPARTGR